MTDSTIEHAADTPKLAVSYAWGPEKNEGSAFYKLVEKFVEDLEKKKISVVRDVKNVKWGEDLWSFMQRLGHGRVVCVFLTDSYLRSPNCTFELVKVWQYHERQGSDFMDQVKLVLLEEPGNKKVSEAIEEGVYRSYWLEQFEKADKGLEDDRGLGGERKKDRDNKKEISDNIDNILMFLKRHLIPDKFEDFQELLESELLESELLESELLESELLESDLKIGSPKRGGIGSQEKGFIYQLSSKITQSRIFYLLIFIFVISSIFTWAKYVEFIDGVSKGGMLYMERKSDEEYYFFNKSGKKIDLVSPTYVSRSRDIEKISLIYNDNAIRGSDPHPKETPRFCQFDNIINVTTEPIKLNVKLGKLGKEVDLQGGSPGFACEGIIVKGVEEFPKKPITSFVFSLISLVFIVINFFLRK